MQLARKIVRRIDVMYATTLQHRFTQRAGYLYNFDIVIDTFCGCYSLIGLSVRRDGVCGDRLCFIPLPSLIVKPLLDEYNFVELTVEYSTRFGIEKVAF